MTFASYAADFAEDFSRFSKDPYAKGTSAILGFLLMVNGLNIASGDPIAFAESEIVGIGLFGYGISRY